MGCAVALEAPVDGGKHWIPCEPSSRGPGHGSEAGYHRKWLPSAPTMLKDGAADKEANVETRDIAELVAESLQP